VKRLAERVGGQGVPVRHDERKYGTASATSSRCRGRTGMQCGRTVIDGPRLQLDIGRRAHGAARGTSWSSNTRAPGVNHRRAV
jgi:hypothetical protein